MLRSAMDGGLPAWEVPGRSHGETVPGLTEFTSFGADPGNLRMLAWLPGDLPPGAALVVVLHGCHQTAEAYARATGWIELAERHGFALLLPEQRRGNNASLCFDWFQPDDTARGQGEVGSIRAMIEHLVVTRGLDRRRVFVTGLSAGGAMAAALLATHPDLFAGGAIVAGLPYGSAATVQQAFASMHAERDLPAAEWGGKVRAASRHAGPWPRIAVWHGEADRVVRASNARETVKQWLDVHGLALAADVRETVDGAEHRAWRGRDGGVRVEAYFVPGMDHGQPIAPRAADATQRVGMVAPFVLDAGISCSFRMAERWGLLGTGAERRRAPPAPAPASGPVAAITRALRTAGLLPGD